MYGIWAAIIYELEKQGKLKRVSVVSVKDSRSDVIIPEGRNDASVPSLHHSQRADT